MIIAGNLPATNAIIIMQRLATGIQNDSSYIFVAISCCSM